MAIARTYIGKDKLGKLVVYSEKCGSYNPKDISGYLEGRKPYAVADFEAQKFSEKLHTISFIAYKK